MEQEITSFDASRPGRFGDILNIENRTRKKSTVGLLAAGYFEYWRMYPGLKETVRRDLDAAAGRLKSALEADVVYPGMVDTLDRAEEAGRAFKDADVEILVIIEGTYLPDFIVLHALEHIPRAEIIIFSTQTGADVGPEDNYEATMRNSALIGTAQLSGTFSKAGRPYRVVVGEISDAECYAEISGLVRAFGARSRLRAFNIGMIGHVFRGMFDLEFDRGTVRGMLGPEVITIQPEHLVNIWSDINDDEISAATAKFSGYKLKTSEDELRRSVRLGLAMRKLAGVYKLDALCFLGQHYIEKMTGAPARIGASMLMAEDKIMVSCEGDIGGLVMMEIMREMTGNPPVQLEWGQFDLKNNALFLLGHGISDPGIASSPGGVSLTGAPEEWGFSGSGVNWEFIAGPGRVTLGHFLNTAAGWQMLISEGEALDFPCLPCNEIHAMVRVQSPVREYLKKLLELGVTHHVAMVHGRIVEELAALADIMGIRKTILK